MFDFSDRADVLVEPPRVDWVSGRPYAFSLLTAAYAGLLEKLAIEKEAAIRALPVDAGWLSVADRNPTTARFSAYSSFLLAPATLPLFFAIHQTYRHLLQEIGEASRPRFIQCWYNIHRAGEALSRHAHPYPFIGTFSAHATGSATRYGGERQLTERDVLVEHVPGQLMVTIGPGHYHETSVWQDPARPRVTFAFDIVNAEQWNPQQVFLPFDM